MFGNNPADFCFCNLPAKLAKSSDDSDWQCTLFLILWLWRYIAHLSRLFEDVCSWNFVWQCWAQINPFFAFAYDLLWDAEKSTTLWWTHWLWLCIEHRDMPLSHKRPQIFNLIQNSSVKTSLWTLLNLICPNSILSYTGSQNFIWSHRMSETWLTTNLVQCKTPEIMIVYYHRKPWNLWSSLWFDQLPDSTQNWI